MSAFIYLADILFLFFAAFAPVLRSDSVLRIRMFVCYFNKFVIVDPLVACSKVEKILGGVKRTASSEELGTHVGTAVFLTWVNIHQVHVFSPDNLACIHVLVRPIEHRTTV